MQLIKLSVSSKKEKKQGDIQRRIYFTWQNKISKSSVTDENINKFPCYLTIKLLQPLQDVNLSCDIQWKRVTPNITTSTQYSQTKKDLPRLLVKNYVLQLSFYLYSSLVYNFPEYRGIWYKKIF